MKLSVHKFSFTLQKTFFSKKFRINFSITDFSINEKAEKLDEIWIAWSVNLIQLRARNCDFGIFNYPTFSIRLFVCWKDIKKFSQSDFRKKEFFIIESLAWETLNYIDCTHVATFNDCHHMWREGFLNIASILRLSSTESLR